MLYLFIEEKAKHLLPRWLKDAPTWMSEVVFSNFIQAYKNLLLSVAA